MMKNVGPPPRGFGRVCRLILVIAHELRDAELDATVTTLYADKIGSFVVKKGFFPQKPVFDPIKVSARMKAGDNVLIVGLQRAKHLNGRAGVIVQKDDEDRWMVEVDAEGKLKVRYSNGSIRCSLILLFFILTMPFLRWVLF
jgi:hypothetical protein